MLFGTALPVSRLKKFADFLLGNARGMRCLSLLVQDCELRSTRPRVLRYFRHLGPNHDCRPSDRLVHDVNEVSYSTPVTPKRAVINHSDQKGRGEASIF